MTNTALSPTSPTSPTPPSGLQAFLRGLLQDLERRCTVLGDRLVALSSGPNADPDLADHVLGAYQVIERMRRNAAQLLADPSLGVPALVRNQLDLYRRWAELAQVVESYPVPFIERYGPTDRRLTRLCRRLARQVRWPLPPPLIGAFSTQYYWTNPAFNLICVPAGEGASLLALPDLGHELGHNLLVHHEDALTGQGGFLREFAAYIAQEKARTAGSQRPPSFGRDYDLLFAQWQDEWVREFVCDIVATYLVGPAYGYQHVRLCVASGMLFHPALGDVADHPADDARLRVVVAALRHLGEVPDADQVQDLWQTYLRATAATEPPGYAVCYPQPLVESLARYAIEGCRALGLRVYTARKPRGDVTALLGEAWQRFLSDPQSFTAWERKRLDGLWRAIGRSR